MPNTTKNEFKLSTGETKEEINHVIIKYMNSIIELDNNSKLIAPNISISPNNVLDYVQLNTNLINAPTTVGALYWDNDDKTFTGIMEPSDGASVKLQLGQEMYIRAVNKTGTTISNGSVVFVSGAQGNRPTIDLADADSYTNASKVIGVATENIGNNLYGYITTQGLVRDLDTKHYTEGDCVYLSTTAGAFTTVSPTDGKARIRVGMITKAHVTDGWLCVKITEDKYMFGNMDSGSYSYFEADGTFVAKGNAVTYRDEYVGGQYFVPTGANAPDEVNLTIAGVVTKKYAFDGATTIEKLGNTFEIPHDADTVAINAGDEFIEWHIHAGASTTASGTATIALNWALCKANGGAIITGSNATASVYFAGTQTVYSNHIFGENLVTPAVGFYLGDLIEFTISRDPAIDTYPNDLIFYKTALHIPSNMLGSRQKYVK